MVGEHVERRESTRRAAGAYFLRSDGNSALPSTYLYAVEATILVIFSNGVSTL